MESKHKNALIGALLAVVFVMAVGYAAFAQQLQINGTANITSKWEVKITDIAVKSVTDPAKNPVGTAADAELPTGTPKFTDTTANFKSTLQSPGDSITYTVTITNSGTLDAKVKSIGWSNQNATASPIMYSFSGLAVGNQVAAGNTTTVDVTVTYDSAVTTQPAAADLTKEATLVIDYEQA